MSNNFTLPCAHCGEEAKEHPLYVTREKHVPTMIVEGLEIQLETRQTFAGVFCSWSCLWSRRPAGESVSGFAPPPGYGFAIKQIAEMSREAAYQQGREDERAAMVAYITREHALAIRDPDSTKGDYNIGYNDAIHVTGTAIEAGEHLNGGDDE